MSVSVQQILGFLRAVAPQELALDWDNVGLLVDAGQPVDGVLTTLDITPAVVREAVENDCQLIVSHHPVIFHPLRTLAADDVPALLMKNGISAICMHTNLDAAPGGVNDTLCDILGIAAEGRESIVVPKAAGASAPRCLPRWRRWQNSAPPRCTAASST